MPSELQLTRRDDCLTLEYVADMQHLIPGDPQSKDEVEADTSGDETDPVDSGHQARDEMFAAVASVRIGY